MEKLRQGLRIQAPFHLTGKQDIKPRKSKFSGKKKKRRRKEAEIVMKDTAVRNKGMNPQNSFGIHSAQQVFVEIPELVCQKF